MKSVYKLIIILGLIQLTSCEVLEQAQGYGRFMQCNFSLQNIEIIELGGINISSIQKPEDLDMMKILALTNQVMNGSLPAKLRVNLNAKNNNTQKASISGLDWQLMLKESEFLTGNINQYVEVQPNSMNKIPINTTIDVLKLIDSNSLDQLLNFVFSKDKKQAFKDLGVGVNVRPYYKLGTEIYKYPGYLKIDL